MGLTPGDKVAEAAMGRMSLFRLVADRNRASVRGARLRPFLGFAARSCQQAERACTGMGDKPIPFFPCAPRRRLSSVALGRLFQACGSSCVTQRLFHRSPSFQVKSCAPLQAPRTGLRTLFQSYSSQNRVKFSVLKLLWQSETQAIVRKHGYVFRGAGLPSGFEIQSWRGWRLSLPAQDREILKSCDARGARTRQV